MTSFPTLRHVADLTGVPPNIVRELEFLRSFCYKLLDRVNSIAPASGSQAAAAAVTPQLILIKKLITAATVIADPGTGANGVPIGREVEYDLTQDSTGGRTVTWNSQFKGVNALTVGRTANYMSVVRFRRISNTQLVLLFAVGDIVI